MTIIIDDDGIIHKVIPIEEMKEIRQEIETECIRALNVMDPKDNNSILLGFSIYYGMMKSLEIIDKHIADLQQ